MIEAGLESEAGLERLLDAFSTLPGQLRPVHYSKNETPDYPGNLIADRSKLAAFAAANGSGFFLLGPSVTYSIRIAGGCPIVCDCYLNATSDDARDFMRHMATARLTFGFACSPDERMHRNRVAVQIGQHAVEAWVGRDTRKYAPGLYWITLISEALASTHGIPLPALAEAALGHEVLSEGEHLLTFFENPAVWRRHAAQLDALCATQHGLFSVNKVTPQVAHVTSLIEFTAIIGNWR
jgi:hypothetical protein